MGRMATLVLLRHAKSAYPPGVADHDRPLNARGRRDAPVAGHLIAQVRPDFDVVLVSTAKRAQQTWELASPAVVTRRRIDVPELYLASAEAMLRRLRDVDADTAIVVSHNPGTEDLAERLSDDTTGDDYRRMLMKFPTAAFAVLESDKPFARWGYGEARLTAFEVGRG